MPRIIDRQSQQTNDLVNVHFYLVTSLTHLPHLPAEPGQVASISHHAIAMIADALLRNDLVNVHLYI